VVDCQKKKVLHGPLFQLEVCLVELVLMVVFFLSDLVQEDELGLPAVPRASLRS
jgi:hypothetical protein